MRITGVRLQNIACFEDLSLDFTNESTGEAAPWVVILGENGTGKSTMLQMIAAACLDYYQLAVIAGRIEHAGYIRGDSAVHYCNVDLELAPADECYSSDFHEVRFHFGIVNFPHDSAPTDHAQARAHPSPAERMYEPTLTGGWFIAGYGSFRRLQGRAVEDNGLVPLQKDSAKPFRFASIFGDTTGMTNVPDWIAGLYFSAVFPTHTDFDVRRLEIARLALIRALPGVSNLEVTKDRQIVVTEGNTAVPLERLSDGYRGTLAWIGDLIRRLFDAYPDSDDPLKESGVVLVDEIDLHLHPKWQRSVVEDVRKLFPNLQFIVTSHSPFVAQDMRPEDKIIVLERSGKDGNGPVVAREENGSLESWSADQILSDYFGLEDGTRGTKTQKAEQRFVRLLGAEAAGKLTARQAKELEQLRGKVDAIPLGETPDERAFYRMADDMVALMERRLQEHETQTNGVHEESENYGDAADSTSED